MTKIEDDLLAELGLSPDGTEIIEASPGIETPVRKWFARPYLPGDPATRHKRDWLYGGHYIRRYVVADVAPGAAGKTSTGLVEAVSMAAHVDLLRCGTMYHRPLRIAYWNGEDTADEIGLRLDAILQHYDEPEFDDLPRVLNVKALALIKQNLFVDFGRNLPIKIADNAANIFEMAEPLVDELTAAMISGKFDVLMIDPFVASHAVGENDNVAQAAIIEQGWGRIAEDADCCVSLSHHVRKGKGGDSGYNAADARGAGAFINACRDVRVFNHMNSIQADGFGIDEKDRWRFFNIDSDKPNMTARGGPSSWRYLESVMLDCVDGTESVGVVTTWEPPAKSDEEKAVEADKLRAEVLAVIDAGKRIIRSAGGGDYNIKKLAAKLGVGKDRLEKLLETLIEEGAIHYRDAYGKTRAGYVRS